MAGRLQLGEKIALLCSYCAAEKPAYREVFDVVRPTNGAKVSFKAGKALASLVPYLLGTAKAKAKLLDDELRQQLLAMVWFPRWLEELTVARLAGPTGPVPDIQEQVRLLAQAYAEHRPKAKEVVSIARDNGMTFELNGHRLLKKLAPNVWGGVTSHSKIDETHKRLLMALPWAKQWVKQGTHRRRVSKLRKAFPIEMKVKLLVKFYTTKPDGSPAERPSWLDSIPQRCPEEFGGGIWHFRAAWFLDDLAENWCPGGRPGVVLSDAQKRAIETLPWFPAWRDDVRASRAKRAAKQA